MTLIQVFKTFLLPIEYYQAQLIRICNNQWFTNKAEFYKELLVKLNDYFGVNYIIPMAKGALPIQIVLNAVWNGGGIMTTPFPCLATTAIRVWEKLIKKRI
jgi:dTDP-4-amino-4,6-dideoxygalactose transaminase